MPGTKIEMKVGDDPDPAPFLFVNEEIKAKIAAKVYDPKRSAYVPHPEEKYVEVGIVLILLFDNMSVNTLFDFNLKSLHNINAHNMPIILRLQ